MSIQSDIHHYNIDHFVDRDACQDALAVSEESGALSRAVLKRVNGMRGGGEAEWTALARRKAADTMIALYSFAANEGFDLDEAVEEQWEDVSQREVAT